MAALALSRSKTKAMYSWWWDSHISPKNSKWLKENLTDMDNKVRMMIKLIEVDEDSFVRRAEVYFKRRPELMKLVEEFYRAYRALAERYDHATGVIRHAHRTMTEAFPDQVPSLMNDDGPINVSYDSDPHKPEMQASGRASPDPDESSEKNGDFTGELDKLAGRKGSKQLNGLEKARKGLNFHEVEQREAESLKKNQKHQVQTKVSSESGTLGKSDADIEALREAIAKLEAEKEAGLLQYQQTLERLSKLESEVSRAKEDSRGLNDRACKAEAEVQNLKETLVSVEAEREASLCQYQQCLDRISNLESHIARAEQDTGQLTERASKAEKETETLKEELAHLKAEKEGLLGKYLELLEKIANLENKLLLAEDYAIRTSERAERAEKEVKTLKETITRLTEEKEAAVHKYEQCLEKIAALEREIAAIQEEAERLRAQVHDGVAKLKGTEEQCLLLDKSNKSLQSEVDSLVQKVGVQDQELSEKQKELGRLWTCVQEERMRFMEAENAFQSLQNSHSKVQEELRSVATELQKKVQLLKDMEVHNQHLQDEVQKTKDENKSLNDLNLSSAVTIRSMQNDIFNLKDQKGKLEQELELRLDQRNALQQEIYRLKEELNNLTQRHQDVLAGVQSVGLEPESFGSSVKDLQDENSKLKESCQRNEVEIAALVEKLGVMEKLIEKNELLENSLADLQAELEGAREKLKALEEFCQMLMGEKSTLAADKATLISQLQITTENLEKLSERNSFLENSLFDVNAELEMLRVKSKNLEDSCRLLNDQNSVLVTEKQTLASQLEMTQQKLEDLGKRHADLEQRYIGLEEERESTLQRVEELQSCLEVEKQEHANSNQLNQTKIIDLESQIRLLQEVGDHMKEEFEEELDKAVNAQFDIFILCKCIQNLRDKNTSLMGYCEKLLEASKLSEKLISELEHTSHEQQEDLRVLSNEIKGLRKGMFQLLEALQSDAGPEDTGYDNNDQRILHHILGKLDDIKISLLEALDENQALVVEKSVILAVLWQLKKDVDDLNAVIVMLRQEIDIRNNQILALQKEMQQLLESNEELILKVRDGNQKEAALLVEVEILRKRLFDLQGAYEDLRKDKCKAIKDKESVQKAYEVLEEEKHELEQECSCVVEEAVALDNLSFVLKNVMSEKARRVVELMENVEQLGYYNGLLLGKMRLTERKMEEILDKNISLEALLKEAENELRGLRLANDKLKVEMANGKETLCMKEMRLSEAEATKVLRQNQILELSEIIQHLESQISRISKEYEEAEARVGALTSELQQGKDAVELWETLTCTFFTELQSACVREALIKDKFYELIKDYEILEEESISKGTDIVQLQERVKVLEGENSEIKAQLAADFSAIMSLQDSVASLEKHTTLQRKLGESDEVKEDVLQAQTMNEEKVAAATQLGGLVDLQDVQGRIRAVEKAVIELKQHAEEQHSNLRSDLDSAIRQLQLLKSQSSSRHGSRRFSKRFVLNPEEVVDNIPIDVPEPGDELLMKDIVLDQVSDRSSDGKNSRRKTSSNDQTLECWETIDHQRVSIDLTVGKPGKPSDLEDRRENRSSRPSSELTVEKELLFVEEEQEGLKRFPQTHHEDDDNKRKFLERLASDVQKLKNLRTTVQDLKGKLEKCPGKEKSAECVGIKDQLEETEEAISKLSDYGKKLIKKIEKSPSFDAASAADSVSDGRSGRRRQCSEQARRMSEKIGRLQLDVQKMHFALMKLDKNKVGKSGNGVPEWNTRVLLRDYLYGHGFRTPRRRIKTRFCGCVQPSTLDDGGW